MTGKAPTLGAFVLRTFLWLPACFAAWYLSAPFHSTVAAGFARFFVALFNAGLISATERQGTELVFVTRLQVPQAAPGQLGVLAVEVDPLLYTYGLAFFLALMLASRARWWKLLAGAAILLPFQGWGIGFDFLAHVGAKMGPEVAAQAGLLAAREAIALCYQVGSLLFPSLVPVALFVAFSRSYVGGLAASASRGHRREPV
jgi:hypothetical protein